MPEIVTVYADVQRVAHMGSAGNCQTDRNADASWPATCTCGEMDIVADTPPTPDPCVTSTFVGSESHLSEDGVWTNATLGYGMKKVEGAARPETLSFHCFAGYTGRAWPANQSSIVTRAAGGSLSDVRVGAGVRLGGFSFHMEGYVFIANFDIDYGLYRLELGGALTEIGTYAVVPTITDVFELSVVGDTLTPTVNGTPLAPVVDATYASGVPGIHAITVADNDAIASWEGCEI